MGLIFASILSNGKDYAGFWIVASDIDDSLFCWVRSYKNENDNISLPLYSFYYIPVSILIIINCYIFRDTFIRLKFGIPGTFVQRMRTMIVSSAIFFYLYWFVLVGTYSILVLIGFYERDSIIVQV